MRSTRWIVLLLASSLAPLARAADPAADAPPIHQPAPKLRDKDAWIDAVATWQELPNLRTLLDARSPDRRRRAARALARLLDAADPKDPSLRDAPAALKVDVVRALAKHDGDGALPRARLLDLADLLAPGSPAAAPLVFGALDDPNPAVRTRAAAKADKLLVDPPDPETLSGLLDALLAPRAKDSPVHALFERLLPTSKQTLGELAAVRVAAGQSDARWVVERCGATDTLAAKLAAQATLQTGKPRSELAQLADQITRGRRVDTRLLADLLTADDPAVGLLAANLAASPLAADRVDVAATLTDSLRLHRVIPAEPLKLLVPDATRARRHAAGHLQHDARAKELADALAVLQALGPPTDPDTRAAITPLLDHHDESIRLDAARALGDDASAARARLPGWLANLRAQDPPTRSLAAKQLHAANLFPPEVTAALVRAVDRRDMPTREGLVTALEQSHLRHIPPAQYLAEAATADENPTQRAYARAALRELKTPGNP